MTSIWDYEDLARHLCNMASMPDDADLDEELEDRFGLDLWGFAKLVEKLLPLTAVGRSPLTDKVYHGFATNGLWLLKEEDPRFDRLLALTSLLNNDLDQIEEAITNQIAANQEASR